MEEELAKALARKAENANKPNINTAGIPNISSTPMQMTKIFGGNDAKRMSFDENMPQFPTQYGTSPLSSILGSSPGGTGYNQGRRDSLKNMWHLQDFGTE